MPLKLLAVPHRFSSAITLPSAVVIFSRSERTPKGFASQAVMADFQKASPRLLAAQQQSENFIIVQQVLYDHEDGVAWGAIASH